MEIEQVNNPLHGLTLKKMVENLVSYYGWEELGHLIPIDCFNFDPTIKSSLKFIRRTDWARTKVERLYTKRFNRINEYLVELEEMELRSKAVEARDKAAEALIENEILEDIETTEVVESIEISETLERDDCLKEIED